MFDINIFLDTFSGLLTKIYQIMKRSTIIGCFVGLLSLTISAQSTQPSTSKSDSGTTIEVQKKPTASVQELLVRYQNLGSQSGSLSEYFTKEEQQLLHSYFNKQKPVKSSQVLSGNGKNMALASAAEPMNPRSFKSEAAKKTQFTPLFVSSGHTDKFGNSTGIDFSVENRPAYKQAPLFLAPTTLTAEDEAEILAAAQRSANTNIENNVVVNNRRILSDIIPTAGATETFNPAAGDHFFDPGGPGGGSTGGTPGNYPNCNCDTQTTLAGVSEINFQFFSVFSNFDYLRIYDGTDATGTKLYDNGPGGANENDITLADMIASNGSSTFTAASGNFFFFFHASSVVDYGGWDVEIVTAGGGGGTDPTVFGLNLRASCSNDFGSFPLPGPYTIAPITTNTNPIYGGDFDGSGTLYAFNATAVTLLTLDTTTGAETTVAPITGLLAGEGLRGMAWNESNGTMYLMAGVGEVGSIYTVDLTTGAATLVGSSTITGWLPIWLAIDSNGNAFMADVGLDSLFSVDLTTGTATLVGALGVNINFAQDADFDPDTDTLYMAAYLGGGVNFFASVDTATGAATTLGSVNADCAELGLVAIMGTGGGGGGGSACSQEDVSNGFENGYGNTNNTVEIADEIIVEADTDFEVDQLTINMINNGGFNSIDVAFYEDAGGMPGTMIGSIMTIVPTSSTVIGTAFGRDVLSIVLDITPTVMLNGTSGSETVYWIGVETPNPVDPVSDAYWETTSIPNPGTDYRVHYDVANGGWTSTLPADGMWNTVYTVSGNCEPIGGGGGCTPGSLATLYAGGNGGNPGGAVYFDITVGASDIDITTIDMNTPESGPFTMDVYVFEGTYVGNQGNPTPWGASAATGSGTGAGAGLPSTATLDVPITMSANTTYAVALVFDATHTHAYTNGDGTNQNYSNGDITLDLGSASNVPFTNPIFDPRVWNGSIGYCVDNGGSGGALATAYGVNNSNVELIGFPVSDPSTVEVFGDSPVTVNFENAGAIDPANPTTGYALDNGGQFYSFDVASGFYTLLGNIPGDWVGMEFDRSSGILYAIAGADLYTIDPVGVSATLVGATGINPADLPIALAIDGAGVGYTYELVSDNLYSIDLTTATATLIGNIGFDANFGQGMCYDPTTDMVYMSAFNSGTFAGEWRSVNLTTGASTLIGPIVTTAATTQVAWVSIGETLPPPACPEPTNLVVSNVTPTTADLSWTAEPNASSGYIWYVFDQGANPISDPPVATGTVPAGTTTATATGLDGGLSYDFYVVADCDSDGLSQLAGPINFATPPACGGKFYDTGGPGGDYQNSENVTTIISPENPGELVTVTFTAFEVEATWDALYVYDGPDASFPIISSGNPPTNSGFPAGGYYGTSIPGPFVSTDPSGALTFVFMSDSSVPQSGWEADVTCALSPPPNDLIVNSIDVDEIGFPYTDPAVHMPAATIEGGNPVNCDLTGANGVWYNFVPSGDGTANATIVTPGGASSVTFYTAPNENAVETDLTLVPQQTNQCAPGTSASIFTLGGQAYYVFVMNTGAITDIVIEGTNIGISENTIAGFSYYPNPTNGILNLNSVENIESVSMYNVLGQLVIENRVNATTSQVDISGLSTGTYIMKVSVNGQIGTYRVLKQ